MNNMDCEKIVTQNKTLDLENLSDNYFVPLWDSEDNRITPGTKKEFRFIVKWDAQCLTESTPNSRSKCFVYEIRFRDLDAEQVSYDSSNSQIELGLVTKKRINNIESFLTHTTYSDYEVTIFELPAWHTFSKEQIIAMRDFHVYLFSDVLGAVKKYFSLNYGDIMGMCFFVVPLKKELGKMVIDWEIIENKFCFQKSCPIETGDIVCPIYKLEERKKYVVAGIRLTQCSFATPDDYTEYLEKKEDNVTIDPTKPQISLKPFEDPLSYVCPIALKKKVSLKNAAFCLPKEEIAKFTVPLETLIKMYCLPAVFHRMNFLCLAEELRIKMENKLNLLSPIKKDSMSTIFFNHLYDETGEYNDDCVDFDYQNRDIQRNVKKNDYILDEMNLFASATNIEMVDSESWIDAPILTILNRNNRRSPVQSDILKAVTIRGSKDVFNNENLEFIGDAFLKFWVNLSLFLKLPNCTEGELSIQAARIVGNRNLFYVGRHHRIPFYMKNQEFSCKYFCPPGFGVHYIIKNLIDEHSLSFDFIESCSIPVEQQLKGLSRELILRFCKLAKDHPNKLNLKDEYIRGFYNTVLNCDIVNDKSVADTVEALIGLYFTKCGIKTAYNFLRHMKILIPEEFSYEEIMTKSTVVISDMNLSNKDYKYLNEQKVEAIMHHTFTNKRLLLEAMNHSPENMLTYQRLEHLGDALLDFLITSYIYERVAVQSPGQLTDLKSSLVNNVLFSFFTIRLGLHKYIRYKMNCQLEQAVSEFEQFEKDNPSTIGNTINYLQANYSKKIPKILGDIFESLAAAIYLDSGKDLNYVWNIYYNIMKNEIGEFIRQVPVDPIKKLHDTVSTFTVTKIQCEYESRCMITFSTKDGAIHEFHGNGQNFTVAKKMAAVTALEAINAEKS